MARNHTTGKKATREGPTFGQLLAARRLRVEGLAHLAGVSVATVYRAKRGENLSRLAGTAIALALGVDLPDVEAAIERSRGAA